MPKPTWLLFLVLPAALAQSASQQPPAQLETVQVGLVRDPAAMPYARMNEMLQGMKKYGQGLFAMDFRLTEKTLAAQPRPKLALAHDEGYLPIAIDAQGRFELPLLPQEQAKNAELATNIPKGQAGMSGRVLLTTPPDQLTMATVRRIMAAARSLRSELLPWYARWLFPQIAGVRVCSAEAKWELEWRENGQLLGLPLSADPKDRDPEVKKGEKSPPCATLTGAEPWPDAARLVAPADAKLSVRLGAGQPS
jgi:hypothetical protein